MNSLWKNTEKEDIAQVQKIKELYNKQFQLVSEQTTILNLLYKEWVDRIKSLRTQYDYMVPSFEKARSQIGKKTKKERENLDHITYQIQDDFCQSRKIKILDVIQGGYESYYYAVTFKLLDKTIELKIPMHNMLNTRNIESAHFGQFVLSEQENEHFSSCRIQSYEIDEISNFIRENYKENK